MLMQTLPISIACAVICVTEGLAEREKPKKTLGRAVKIAMGMTRMRIRTQSAILNRSGAKDLAVSAAAPFAPDVIAALAILAAALAALAASYAF